MHMVAIAIVALPAVAAPSALHELRQVLARCPDHLTEATFTDLAPHEQSALPPVVARWVSWYPPEDGGTPDWTTLREWDRKIPIDKFLCQLERWIDPDRALRERLQVDVTQALLLPEPELAPRVVVQLAPGSDVACPPSLQAPVDVARPFRALRREEVAATVSPERPYGALRVAIDPGHFGGALAGFERRADGLPAAEPGGASEGDLTLRTALELDRKLSESGIETFLTRTGPVRVHDGVLPLRPIRDGATGGDEERRGLLRAHVAQVLDAS
jgi:N-acetylmuramoyl-L-alanine amidase